MLIPAAIGWLSQCRLFLLLILISSLSLPSHTSAARIPSVSKRENSPTDVCKRWSHQTAIVNGTMYIYGGRTMTDASQGDKTWNNDFLTLDLKEGWDISSPKFTGLPQPKGPPPVSNGYLWNSYSSLFLYGGEYSDNPPVEPDAFSLWEYQLSSSSWKEHKDPKTTSGKHSDKANQPVQQSAEGAGINIPGLGRGLYFGGHLDGYTTKGWSQSIARVYLKSMIEFTFPGFFNSEVEINTDDKKAGSEGIWRNITEGGLQDSAGFTERADGVLVYVPGFGEQGTILGLAGGTNSTFTQMNVIDVYDIANSTWYKQSTSGKTPDIRVNPCAVAASAADGSSTQVYLYGGQNLIPYGKQIQYDDIWILTIPSFTWIKVDTSDQSVPPARAGHTCNIWNGQMVVVGGYVGQDLSCDSPGVYVFDASDLKWKTKYTAHEGGNDLNQQATQTDNSSGLSGSYGYRVPKQVQSVIGGDAMGRATKTSPAVEPEGGPFATGGAITYTIPPNPDDRPSGSDPGSSKGNDGPNIAAIVAGVIAGCLGVLAIYLGFCAYVYRRQLVLYKKHVAAAQRSSGGSGHGEKAAFFFPPQSSGNASADVHSLGPGSSIVPLTATSGVTRVKSNPAGQVGDGGETGTGTGASAGNGVRQGTTTANSSTDDLLAGQEPTFLGVMLNPRRSLRVINKD